jgi:head-tail adaptor
MSGAGRLRRRLTLEARVAEPDGSGGFEAGWAALGLLWAELEPLGGGESFAGGRPRPRQRYRIVVRGAPWGAPSRPRADQRFRERPRVFDILSVAETDGEGWFLEILAEEGAA